MITVPRPPKTARKSQKALTRYEVPMLAHALRVLETLAASEQPVRLQDLALRTGASKSSAFRIAATLEAHGYVQRDPETGGYQIGRLVLELGESARRRDLMRERARPHLKSLQHRFGETVNLGALRGNRLVYVDVLESGHAFRMATPPGSEIPPHASAIGKAILAFQPEDRIESVLSGSSMAPFTTRTITDREHFMKALARVRKTGIAADDEEVEIGASCVASAIRQSDGRANYAISVSGPTGRIAARTAEIAAALTKACRALGSLPANYK